MADVLTARGQLKQRGADRDSRTDRAAPSAGTQGNPEVRRDNDTTQIPLESVVAAARASKDTGESGEPRFRQGRPPPDPRVRDNNVKQLEEAQNTDSANASTDTP